MYARSKSMAKEMYIYIKTNKETNKTPQKRNHNKKTFENLTQVVEATYLDAIS